MTALDAVIEPDLDRLRRAVMSRAPEAVIDLRFPAEYGGDVGEDFAVRQPPVPARSEVRVLVPLTPSGFDALTLATFAGLLGLAVMNALDVITTRWALSIAHSHGLQAVEANPLARLLLTGWRVELVKTVAILGLAVRAVRHPGRLPVVCVLWAVVGVYAMVVVSNALTLRSLQ